MSVADKRQKVADIINKVWLALEGDVPIGDMNAVVVDDTAQDLTTIRIEVKAGTSLLIEEQREKRNGDR